MSKQMLSCSCFQETVGRYTIRHKSILDILSKAQEAQARTQRVIAKAVTSCGCIQIHAGKKPFPPEASLADLESLMESHLRGELCVECREHLEEALGRHFFYLTALCNTLGVSLTEVLAKEQKKVSTLQIYNLT